MNKNHVIKLDLDKLSTLIGAVIEDPTTFSGISDKINQEISVEKLLQSAKDDALEGTLTVIHEIQSAPENMRIDLNTFNILTAIFLNIFAASIRECGEPVELPDVPAEIEKSIVARQLKDDAKLNGVPEGQASDLNKLAVEKIKQMERQHKAEIVKIQNHAFRLCEAVALGRWRSGYEAGQREAIQTARAAWRSLSKDRHDLVKQQLLTRPSCNQSANCSACCLKAVCESFAPLSVANVYRK